MARRSKASDNDGLTESPKLRTPEAAHYVGLAKATLVKLRCVGGGPQFRRLGRAVIYERADLEAWVRTHGKQRSTSDSGRAA
jgi:predicted DNA-binding transcriptional regulator AlpA